PAVDDARALRGTRERRAALVEDGAEEVLEHRLSCLLGPGERLGGCEESSAETEHALVDVLVDVVRGELGRVRTERRDLTLQRRHLPLQPRNTRVPCLPDGVCGGGQNGGQRP